MTIKTHTFGAAVSLFDKFTLPCWKLKNKIFSTHRRTKEDPKSTTLAYIRNKITEETCSDGKFEIVLKIAERFYIAIRGNRPEHNIIDVCKFELTVPQ